MEIDPSERESWSFQEHGVSRSEARVLDQLSTGKSNKQISEDLFMGIETVRFNLKKLYRKLGIHTRAEAIVWVIGHTERENRTAVEG